MRETCHSEYGKIKSILLHAAKNSFVSDANIQEQWQMLNYLFAPDYPLALKEYDYFQGLLSGYLVGYRLWFNHWKYGQSGKEK